MSYNPAVDGAPTWYNGNPNKGTAATREEWEDQKALWDAWHVDVGLVDENGGNTLEGSRTAYAYEWLRADALGEPTPPVPQTLTPDAGAPTMMAATTSTAVPALLEDQDRKRLVMLALGALVALAVVLFVIKGGPGVRW